MAKTPTTLDGCLNFLRLHAETQPEDVKAVVKVIADIIAQRHEELEASLRECNESAAVFAKLQEEAVQARIRMEKVGADVAKGWLHVLEIAKMHDLDLSAVTKN